MSRTKLERLVNLLMLLLSSSRPRTVEEIGRLVPGYGQDDAESFRRMFERDKEDLRQLGVPLQTEYVDAWESEQGYRIRPGDYQLAPLSLEPDEAAALALAARLWQSTELAQAGEAALRKLRAAGIEARPLGTGIDPRVEVSEPAFEPCLAAARAGQAIAFGYRAAGTGPPVRRTVEPWGLAHRRGRWYLVGHDRDRSATRVFRLSRVDGPVRTVGAPGAVQVPEGVDLLAQVASMVQDPPVATATVRVAPGAGWELRRAASSLVEDDDGSARASVPMGDLERFADWVAGFGPDVTVLDPPEVRRAVVARLRAAAAAGAG